MLIRVLKPISLGAGAPEQPKNKSLVTQKVERYNMSYLKESCLRVILRYVVVFNCGAFLSYRLTLLHVNRANFGRQIRT